MYGNTILGYWGYFNHFPVEKENVEIAYCTKGGFSLNVERNLYLSNCLDPHPRPHFQTCPIQECRKFLFSSPAYSILERFERYISIYIGKILFSRPRRVPEAQSFVLYG